MAVGGWTLLINWPKLKFVTSTTSLFCPPPRISDAFCVGLRDRMSNGGMPNCENDVLRTECRKLNSTKRRPMLSVTLLVTFVRTMSSFINLWCAHIRHFPFQVLHFQSFDLFRSVNFRWCKAECRAPGDDRCNVYSCRGLWNLNWSVDLWSLEGQSSHQHLNNGKRYAPQSPLCPNCIEFIHRTRRPFRLIAAQIETFAADVAVGIENVKPLNLIRTLLLLRTRNIMPPKLPTSRRSPTWSEWVVTWFLPRTRFHFWSLLFRHSALSAFRLKMRSAFRPLPLRRRGCVWAPLYWYNNNYYCNYYYYVFIFPAYLKHCHIVPTLHANDLHILCRYQKLTYSLLICLHWRLYGRGRTVKVWF